MGYFQAVSYLKARYDRKRYVNISQRNHALINVVFEFKKTYYVLCAKNVHYFKSFRGVHNALSVHCYFSLYSKGKKMTEAKV